MNKKLHVGNLSYATTEDELRQLFAEVGPVASVNVITDRSSGQSKGFAFVEMESAEDAQTAIERLNNHAMGERNITVAEARPPRERSYDGGRGGYQGGGGGRRGSSSRGGRHRY